MTKEQKEQDTAQVIHDIRGGLNRISMHAELVKLTLEGNMPVDKALSSLDSILASCQQCSEQLLNLQNK